MTILDTLCTDQYLAWSDPGWQGVLKHGVYHFHKKLGVDESVCGASSSFSKPSTRFSREATGRQCRPVRRTYGEHTALDAAEPWFSAQTPVRRLRDLLHY